MPTYLATNTCTFRVAEDGKPVRVATNAFGAGPAVTSARLTEQSTAAAVQNALKFAAELAETATAPNARTVGADGLDAAQRRMCKALGITPAQFLATAGEK